ncbi:hypothetical protein N7492_008769 [Penicillium capsulatum]|uniref:Uncharacterized protein n=1 Tax=Penicillium capsulatum TaxID=69766 RepID=A0A9W9LG83_9EURO|nr:hypothetical protein N7492_008769 [Penicillium capsulatum]KAJ6106172.1 hypothetical protein N7512_009689 [Penicillium capsulatum]
MMHSLTQLPTSGFSTSTVPLASSWAGVPPNPPVDAGFASPEPSTWEDIADGDPGEGSFLYTSPSTWGQVEARATPGPAEAEASPDESLDEPTTTPMTQTTTLPLTTYTKHAQKRKHTNKQTQKKTKSTSTSDPEEVLATQITVGAPRGAPSGSRPEVCHKATYRYQTKMSLPTGIVRIRAGQTGWGPPGSIWNFTTSAGAKLINMKAPCQGSACTGINGNGNKEYDGDMQKRKDGSWYMNVTENMQHALMISGTLVPCDGPQGRKKKHTVQINANPPCGPIAASCVGQDLKASYEQWDAYATDGFLDEYLRNHSKVKSMEDFRIQVVNDFYSPESQPGDSCDITGPTFSCEPPGGQASRNCEWRAKNPKARKKWTSDDEARGMLLAHSIMRYTQFVYTVWDTLNKISGRIKDKVDEVTHSVWGNAQVAEQKSITGKALTLTGIAVGFLTAMMVIVDAFTAGAGTSFLVAGSIAAASTLGLAGNLNSEDSPGSADNLFIKAVSEKNGIDDLIQRLQKQYKAIYQSSEWGHKGINDTFKGGAWVSKGVEDQFNGQGHGDMLADWMEKVLIINYIQKALMKENAYILFLRYSDKVKYYNEENWGLSQDECELHFEKNENWHYAVECKMGLPGKDGVQGMALFTRPSSQGSESSSWSSPNISLKGHKIDAVDILHSAIRSHFGHGFNYTVLDQDWGKIFSDGPQATRKLFKEQSVQAAGLFPIPVCEIDNVVYIPGMGIVRRDWKDALPHSESNFFHTNNPGPCKNYQFRGKHFVDFVSDKVVHSLDDSKVRGTQSDCKLCS